MKRLAKIIIPAVALLTMTGCESSGIVHDKNYLQAVSVSGTDEKKLSFAFFSEGTDSIISVSGDNLTEALKNAELKSGRKIITGYTELVILDDTDCCSTLEFLLHEWKVSPSCKIVYGENGGEILGDIQAEQLEGKIERAIEQEKAPECDIITVLGELLSNNKSAAIAEIYADGTVGDHTIISET